MWLQPTRGDWTEQIKQDMEDFVIPTSFEPIQVKSKEAFKRYIKIRAKGYALDKLLGKDASHSKMKFFILIQNKNGKVWRKL